MRYPASEKLEIIRLVEGSHLPTKRTLDKLGIPRTTFYRWYDRYLSGGPEALEDRSPKPSRVWNRIPQPIREKIKDLALKESGLSPRELAVRFTDTEKYFVSEASVYRILKSYDLITSPAYVVLSAAEELEFPRFDGHFFIDEGECFSCREQGTRTLRNSGISWSRWCALGAVLKVWRGSMNPALPRSTNGSGKRLPMKAMTQAA